MREIFEMIARKFPQLMSTLNINTDNITIHLLEANIEENHVGYTVIRHKNKTAAIEPE